MRVLVSGAAGYIGSALVKELTRESHSVISLDNLSRGSYDYLLENLNEDSSLKLHVGDVRDQERLEEVVRNSGVEAIVHLAAIPGLERCRRDPNGAITTNVHGTYNVLESARKRDVGRVVFTSSAAVYGDPSETPVREEHQLRPTNLYGVTKLAAEKLLDAYHQSYGLDTVILRFGNVYGVGLYTYWETVIPKFVKQALNGQSLTIYGDGWQARDFIHIWDIVQAIKLVLKAGKGIAGEVFNVGTEKPTPVNAIADTVSKIVEKRFGTTIKRVHLPPRKGEPYVKDFCLSAVRVKTMLGFAPKWTIEDGINQLIDFVQKSKTGKELKHM
jgi:UDP-glucose 4-epimerase